jgi:hypothetical protein
MAMMRVASGMALFITRYEREQTAQPTGDRVA